MHIDPKLDVDVRTIPAELQHISQWVCWKYQQVDGEWKKPPLNPKGGGARVDDPQTWGGLEAAQGRAQEEETVAGVGFVLTHADPFVVVDLDHCIDGGTIEPWAQAIIDRLSSYTEYSPSGEGVHIWATGQLPRGGRRRGNVEIYDSGRYVTVTGMHVDGTPREVHERTPQLQALHASVFGEVEESSTGGGAPMHANGMHPHDDELLWAQMFSSRAGDRIRRLYGGDTSDYGGDHSQADQGLCNDLAFWTAGDAARMDRMFRQTKLMREKWDKVHRAADNATYGQMTIEKAIRDTPNAYGHIHTNGTAANGSAPKPASPEPPLLQQLLDDLQSQESTAAVELWAARTVERAAQLKPSEQLQLEVTIKQRLGNDAAAERFLDKKWTPAVKGTTRKTRNKDDALDLSEQMFEALHGLGYSFRLNELEDTIEVNGQRIDDILRSEIHLKMKDRGFPKTYVDDAINTLAGRSLYHPVQEYLNGLKWDGENHFYGFASFLHGDGTVVEYDADNREPFIKVAVYRWMLGCVATALDGANMDVFQHQNPMLVLIGAQGKGKSTLVRWLCSGLGPRYYRESPLNPHSTDDVRSMVTKWIWEVSELGASLRRADREALKSFITTQQFTYRKPYARYDITKPKLCSLVGTLNPDGSGFLDDPSGHRRYIPVVLNDIDYRYRELVDVDQLWAQIVHEYRQGKRPELTPAEREILAQAHQQNEVDNPLETYINKYFDIDPHNELLRTHTSTIIDRLRAFGVSLPNNVRVAGKEIAEVLSGLGLHNNGNVPFRSEGALGRGWYGIAPNSKETPIR